MEYCICGHRKDKHQLISTQQGEICQECVMLYDDLVGITHLKNWDFLHTFKLDNLKLIEDLAKQKGLV